ncbi:serine O-acetyltransferase EpsC [Paenibacillus sp. SI8]|uniref:serine O-acetyltransferase EpsC n=1 Tax=unclassified Paenibacillus TaxID=185978 RepID=UPI0034656A67
MPLSLEERSEIATDLYAIAVNLDNLSIQISRHELENKIRLLIQDIYALFFPDRASMLSRNQTEWFAKQLDEVEQRIISVIHAVVCGISSDTCDKSGECLQHAAELMRKMPEIRWALSCDVKAAFEGDPAANSMEEVVVAYPGLLAVTVYRIAHQMHTQGVPLIPRKMSAYIHEKTGIDIHPGAQIGKGFFIDHGTGVVIGETCQIKDDVKLYQGVTLGALSVPMNAKNPGATKTKRHPTIEDHVTIYAGATILGGDTVIGSGSVIGGNVWCTSSVPPGSKVIHRPVVDLQHSKMTTR